MDTDRVDSYSLDEFKALVASHEKLKAENERLRALLHVHGIDDTVPEIPFNQCGQDTPSQQLEMHFQGKLERAIISKQSQPQEKIVLFMSLFRGRPDVYARRWHSKDEKAGYSPVCKNEWVPNICGKPKMKCANCSHAAYLPYDEEAVETHLNGTAVLGIYPLLKDDTCAFLAIDFDEASWRKDVQAVASFCEVNHVPCAVEISRSGNGAHLWFFFDEPVEADYARRFGTQVLSMTMQEHAQLSFTSYDRMFPNQDSMPNGGFGNLIALPFQREAYRHGGSIFVDNQFQPYNDQWTFLSSIQRLAKHEMDMKMAKWHIPLLGVLRADVELPDSKPWQRKEQSLDSADFPATIECAIADMLYIRVTGITERALNQIRRLAAFRNPQFYQAQAMHMPVWNKPRIICCAEFDNGYLCLPRGCADDFTSFAEEKGVKLSWQDDRNPGSTVDVTFTGKLRDEQQASLDALSAYDNGVLSATTAFGKTVIGAALIGQKKVNTLILVHRQQLLNQWRSRLGEFLVVKEELPEEPKKRGRKKRRDIIGSFGAGKDTRSEIIDVAMIQSMGTADNIVPWIGNYGMVIVDECHHVPAVSFEQVLKKIPAKYVYGLTATPTRQDGHHPILYMYLGDIRYSVDAKVQAAKRPFLHIMIPRFTGTHFQIEQTSGLPLIGQYYTQIALDDLRNHQIVDKLQQELRHLALVLHVFIYTDEGRTVERLRQEGFTNDAIDFRILRSKQAWNDYLEYNTDVITIINNSNITDFHRKINRIIQQYSDKNESPGILFVSPMESFELIRPLIGYKSILKKQLDKYEYSKNIFLMMKFRPSNIGFYEHIKNELQKKGLRCVRADDQDWNITNDVYNPLAVLYCCKYGIALFDEPEKSAHYNPNVAYELGIMHFQRKNCLILKHSSINEVPFDIIKNLYVQYTKEIEFERILDKWIHTL